MLGRMGRGLFEIVAALLLVIAAPSFVHAAEDTTITAFSAWRGSGQLFETGPDEATFIGALGGTVYVETDKGPIDSGQLTCPAIVKIDLTDRSQIGTGRCTIRSREGDRVYGDVACTGYFLIGCQGTFTITGGTGRFAGITGNGPVVIRSDFGQRGSTGASTVQDASGIIYWRDLHYQIP